MDYSKIIFVDTDNTCRSIMAEAVMNSVNRNDLIEVSSAGLIVLFPEPVNPKAVAILKGYQLLPAKQYSEELTQELIGPDTLLLTMTEYETRQVKKRFGEDVNVTSIGLFCGQYGDIEEPHGGTLADYGACYEYIDLVVKVAAEILFRGK